MSLILTTRYKINKEMGNGGTERKQESRKA